MEIKCFYFRVTYSKITVVVDQNSGSLSCIFEVTQSYYYSYFTVVGIIKVLSIFQTIKRYKFRRTKNNCESQNM